MWSGLRSLGIGEGDEVLLPDYLCESVVTPVEVVGATPRFYRVSRELRFEAAEAMGMATARTRAIVVIHYFGMPGPVRELVRGAGDRKIAVIEDCAHALFSADLGQHGDVAFFSPWKSLPLPDGGLLRTREAVDAGLPRLGSVRVSARSAYRMLPGVESFVGWTPRTWALRSGGFRDRMHREVSGASVVPRLGSALSWTLFQGADAATIRDVRRANYLALLEAALDCPWCLPLFGDLADGVCPLGLALVVERRDQVLDQLLRAGVNARTYWHQLPCGVSRSEHPDAHWLSDRILVLPIHQQLSDGQVGWIIECLRRVRVE
jgi:dTDP-4-amino-4,6-dideoxygalactose transaminase